MGNKTAISWTNKTWNPWQGCHKVSPGCKNCYMYRDKKRYGQDPETVVRSKEPTFNSPLKWPKEPTKIFTCSWSDWFHTAADTWRDDAWDIIRKTPYFTYQILTKRPENIADRLPKDWGENGWENVWFGVSAENQKYADERIPILLNTPARVRFVSAEPLLGPINLHPYLWESAGSEWAGFNLKYPGLDQVIVGGESGSGARQMEADWARSLRDQCVNGSVSFFFKQWGGLTPKTGGSLLDGVGWEQMPEAVI